MKKLLLWCLLLALLVPASALAEASDFEFDPETGSILDYTGTVLDVVVPAEIGGVPVVRIGYDAFKNDDVQLTSIVLPEGLEIIDEDAFHWQASLISVDCPDSVRVIAEDAFNYGYFGSEFDWPKALEEIGECAFYNTRLAGALILPPNVAVIGESAFGVTEIESVVLPSADIRIEGNAFEGCEKLREIVVPADTSDERIAELAALFPGENPGAQVVRGEPVPAITEEEYARFGGLWYLNTVQQAGIELSAADIGMAYTLQLNDDGTAVMDTGEPEEALWTVDGDSMTLSVEGADDVVFTEADGILSASGDGMASKPIGTGPFKFVSRTPQESIVLEKFQDYWGAPAYLDKVTLKVIEDGQTLVMSLRSGAVDMAERLEASQVAELQDLTILEGSSNVVQALYLNNAFEPFSDMRVRQALCYAIDKHMVIDLAADGHGTAVGSSMFPAFGRYFMPELTDFYETDAAKAKELLEEAGYAGLEFTITVPSNMPAHVDTAQVIVELLRQAGVNAKIDQVEWATWLSDTYQGRNFEATVVGMDAHGLAASDMLARFQSDSGKNFINYNNPEYDEVYAKAMATVDEAEQTELFKQCETILAETAANVYIQDVASFVAMQPDVGGYLFYPLYVMDLSAMYRIG